MQSWLKSAGKPKGATAVAAVSRHSGSSTVYTVPANKVFTLTHICVSLVETLAEEGRVVVSVAGSPLIEATCDGIGGSSDVGLQGISYDVAAAGTITWAKTNTPNFSISIFGYLTNG